MKTTQKKCAHVDVYIYVHYKLVCTYNENFTQAHTENQHWFGVKVEVMVRRIEEVTLKTLKNIYAFKKESS